MGKMMETIKAWLKKRSVVIFLAQIGIYFMLTATWCVVVYITERDPWVATASVRTNAVMFFLLLVVFMANFYVLVLYLYEDKSKLRRWLFWLVEFALVFLLNYDLFFPRSNTDHGVVVHLYYYQFAIIWLVLNYVVAIAAISVRYFIRQSDLRKQLLEEKQRNAEAELAWLKNQLNPHFLFNTLNNISSLTQIDADEAQNSIGELSDLLRYALYETQQKEVPLCGEIAFMENYISLMALRCDKREDNNTFRCSRYGTNHCAHAVSVAHRERFQTRCEQREAIVYRYFADRREWRLGVLVPEQQLPERRLRPQWQRHWHREYAQTLGADVCQTLRNETNGGAGSLQVVYKNKCKELISVYEFIVYHRR